MRKCKDATHQLMLSKDFVFPTGDDGCRITSELTACSQLHDQACVKSAVAAFTE